MLIKNYWRIFIILTGLFVANPVNAMLNVLACEPEWAALVKILGGQHVKVTQATTALQDPHQIQARPSLNSAARTADLLVCTGAELEIGWLPMIQEKANNARIFEGRSGFFAAADYVKMLDIPKKLDRSEGDIHAQGNPHIQLDPRNYLPIAEGLTQRLSELDPKNANDYQQAAAQFKQDWQTAINEWELKAQALKEMPIVVHHHSWIYLTNWLGLKQVSTLEPKPGIPPSAAFLTQVFNQVKNQEIKLILCTPYESKEAAMWLSHKINAPVVVLPFTVGGTPNVNDLKSLFDVTLQLLYAHR